MALQGWFENTLLFSEKIVFLKKNARPKRKFYVCCNIKIESDNNFSSYSCTQPQKDGVEKGQYH